MVSVTRELAIEHYQHLKDMKFFDELIQYLMGEFHTRRVMALVYSGDNSIAKIREICGATNPEEADPASIRGGYGRITTKGIYENAIHASANSEDAEREIKLWFTPDELTDKSVYPSKKQTVTEERLIWV